MLLKDGVRLRMKNESSLKNQIFKGGSRKTNVVRGNCLKRGPWTVFIFKEGGLEWKRGGGAFEEGVDTPMHTMMSFPDIGECDPLSLFPQYSVPGFSSLGRWGSPRQLPQNLLISPT